MNWLDVVIVAIVAGSVTYSIIKGLFKEIFFLGGIIGGLFAGLNGFSYVVPHVSRVIDRPKVASTLSFIIIAAAVFVIFRIIGWRVGKKTKRTGMAAADRALGAALGAVKGAVLVSILLILLISFTEKGKGYIAGSRLSPHFLTFSKALSAALPGNLKDGFRNVYKNLRKG